MEWRKSPNMPGTIIADEPRPGDETEQFYGGRVVCEAVANDDDMNKILAVNDLLAACEELVKMIDAYDSWNVSWDAICRAASQAKVAIKKARGE